MSATLVDKTGFSRDAVVALSESKNEPTWLRDKRLEAWDTYESIPMPARSAVTPCVASSTNEASPAPPRPHR